MSRPPVKRCALYTRKSSEEGLEQDFNSLDAQREACEAFVASQAGEGWKALQDRFDDGGISGATMERPGLQSLLAEIRAGRVDVVVVYKIDRLTRSLADFARMVEVFEAHQVSFVSVTQAFNTTTSMGRLTLNVLLSFAQFEREVTGERIRDKIAASKKKGMWMGGVLPLGYDAPVTGSRALQVNEGEAQTVRWIFKRYLELGSVHALERELVAAGVRSKRHVTAKGKVVGDAPMSRGALFYLLRNRTYLGEIRHRKDSYPGQHNAILDRALFDAVQDQLAQNTRRGPAPSQTGSRYRLTGRLFDAAGEPMSPASARGSKGKRYRYYVSASLQQGAQHSRDPDIIQRISADRIEEAVGLAAMRLVTGVDPDTLAPIERVDLGEDYLVITAPAKRLQLDRLEDTDRVDDPDGSSAPTRILIAGSVKPARGSSAIIAGRTERCGKDEKLIAALKRAYTMVSRDGKGRPIIHSAPPSPYERQLIRLAFLSPDIQRQILAGDQPAGMTLASLLDTEIPLSWERQERLFQISSLPA